MSSIAQILELLKDGEWHEIKVIAEKTQLCESKVGLITTFLAEYDFLELETKEHETRFSPSLSSFLNNIQIIENNEPRLSTRK